MNTDQNHQRQKYQLEKICSHEKCKHFSEQERNLVSAAVELAERVHKNQKRKSKQPYITHVYDSIKIYLDETLAGDERCDIRDLLVLILHDCIEDVDDGDMDPIVEIYEKFGVNIWIDVLRLSEPSAKVMSNIRSLQEKSPYLFEVTEELGFLHMYDLVDENNPEKWIAGLTSDATLREEMLVQIKEYWYHYMALLYHAQSDPKKQKKIFADLITLGNIASLSPRLFRIKGTERRHNLQDYQGLLNSEGVLSARRTMDTTTSIYVPKAREVGDFGLMMNLIFDRNKERAAFVKARLLR